MGFRPPEHHSVVCLTTEPQPLPKTSYPQTAVCCFLFQFPVSLFSLRISSSLRLLPRHPVISILPSIFTLITYSSRQFLRKMWPILLAFLFLLYSSLILCNICSLFTRSVQQIFFILLQHVSKFSEMSIFQHHTHLCSKCTLYWFLPCI